MTAPRLLRLALVPLLLAAACGGQGAATPGTPTLRPLPTATVPPVGDEATERLRAYIRSGAFSATTWIASIDDVQVRDHEAQALTRLAKGNAADRVAALGICEAMAAFAFGPASRGLRLLSTIVYDRDGQPIAGRAGVRDPCEPTP